MRKVKRNDIHKYEYEFDFEILSGFAFNNSINIFFAIEWSDSISLRL